MLGWFAVRAELAGSKQRVPGWLVAAVMAVVAAWAVWRWRRRRGRLQA